MLDLPVYTRAIATSDKSLGVLYVPNPTFGFVVGKSGAVCGTLLHPCTPWISYHW